MNMQSHKTDYRAAFLIALALNVLLLAGMASAFWYMRRAEKLVSEAITPASPAAAMPAEPPLAPIQLTPQRMQSIGVRLAPARVKEVSDEVRVTGSVEVDERRMSYVQVRFPGWIRKVFVDATYQNVRHGQPLFTIYSPDLVTTEQEYLLARRNREALSKSSVSGVAAGADSLFDAARQRLEQWQVPEGEIRKLESTGRVIQELTIESPTAGYVLERNALPNLYVQPETRLYTVADLSTVWVYAQVFQTDLGKIAAGDPATVTVDAYPGTEFRGRVDQVLPQVDMATRTTRVRLVFANPGLKLKPGMFVNVSFHPLMGRRLVVPAAAVFHSGMRQLVFISQGEGMLEPREIELGPRAGEEYVVLKGLKEGETIVTSANFLIDSESQLEAAAGAFMPPPPGAGGAGGVAAVQVGAAAAQAKVELTTEPSPPRKGSNIFRVKLTGADDAPITGAQVNATFFMPAMPAMGMGAMKVSVDLAEKGNGLYEGRGELGSGGAWQGTITARKDGRTLVTRQLSVNATGGM